MNDMSKRRADKREGAKRKLSEASDEQKLLKRSFPRSRMSRKCQKQTFRALGEAKPPTVLAEIGLGSQNLPPFSSKNGDNCKFRGRNRQKTAKTANSVGRIIKKRKKPAFPTLGKVKITRFLRFSLERKAVVAIENDHDCLFLVNEWCKNAVFLGKQQNFSSLATSRPSSHLPIIEDFHDFFMSYYLYYIYEHWSNTDF